MICCRNPTGRGRRRRLRRREFELAAPAGEVFDLTRNDHVQWPAEGIKANVSRGLVPSVITPGKSSNWVVWALLWRSSPRAGARDGPLGRPRPDRRQRQGGCPGGESEERRGPTMMRRVIANRTRSARWSEPARPAPSSSWRRSPTRPQPARLSCSSSCHGATDTVARRYARESGVMLATSMGSCRRPMSGPSAASRTGR